MTSMVRSSSTDVDDELELVLLLMELLSEELDQVARFLSCCGFFFLYGGRHMTCLSRKFMISARL